jgi:hypothetical protein
MTQKTEDYMRTHKAIKNLKVKVKKRKGKILNRQTGKFEANEEITTTASIPNPADTAMGPRFTTHNVMDRRKKKKPSLLKRFKSHMDDNA